MAPDPLSPAVFNILLALAHGDRHGYAIMQEVRDHGLAMGPGTLYGSINRMLEAGLIAEAPPPAGEPDARRRFYRLCAKGRTALTAEAQRMQQSLTVAASRGIPFHPAPSHPGRPA